MNDRFLTNWTYCTHRDQWVHKEVCAKMLEEKRCRMKRGKCKAVRHCSISEENRQRRATMIRQILHPTN